MRGKWSPFEPEKLTFNDLRFVLNHFGVDNVTHIAQTLEKEMTVHHLGKVKGNILTSLGVEDVMQRQRILLSLHTLTNGLVLDDVHLDECGICQNQTPEASFAYLTESNIDLPKQRVLELKALVGHLMLMDPTTIRHTFHLPHSDAAHIYKAFKEVKKRHLEVSSHSTPF